MFSSSSAIKSFALRKCHKGNARARRSILSAMSTIGSYAVLTRHQYPVCLERAREIRSETSGRWLFKKTEIAGVSEFKQAWQAALVDEVSFDHSGYVLGNYLDAQQAVNEIQLADEESDEAH